MNWKLFKTIFQFVFEMCERLLPPAKIAFKLNNFLFSIENLIKFLHTNHDLFAFTVYTVDHGTQLSVLNQFSFEFVECISEMETNARALAS